MTQSAPTDTDLLPTGTLLGERFEIIELLGEGGMGKVYRSKDQAGDRIVAVKVLHKAMMGSREYVSRFKREAAAASRFRHPAAVKVFASGEGVDRQPFIAMELIEGKSLKDVIEKEAPLSVGRACNIMRQVLRGLGAAHQRGIVHRDVKPDNVRIIHDEDGIERPKLLDFGVAKIMEADAQQMHLDEQFTTKTGVLVGTPKYMAPEQLQGSAVDGRADLYAAGAMFYEMLAGKPPFEAEDVFGFVQLHMKAQVRPLTVAFGNLDIPADLDALILSMLEKDPKSRPSDASAIADQVDGWAMEGPGASEMEKARRKGAIAILAAALVSAGAVMALTGPVGPAAAAAALGLGGGAAACAAKFPRPSVYSFLKRVGVVAGVIAVCELAATFLSGQSGYSVVAAGHGLAALLAYVAYLVVWSARFRVLRFLAAGVLAPAVSAVGIPILLAGGEGSRAYYYQNVVGAMALQESTHGPELARQTLMALGIVAGLFAAASIILPRPGAARFV